MPPPNEIKCKPSKRRARSKRKPQKRYKCGRITRNPFLNFLRFYRKSKRGIPVTEIAKTAGKMWKLMSERERSPYNNMARKAPIKRRMRRDNKKTAAKRLKKVCEEKRIRRSNQQIK